MEHTNKDTTNNYNRKQRHYNLQKNGDYKLIPQYIKNITINNNVCNKEHNVKSPKNGNTRISRIIVKKPSFSKDISDDNLVGGILSSLFSMNKNAIDENIVTIPNKDMKDLKQQQVNEFRENVDFSELLYIDEVPETLDDLLELVDIAKIKYDKSKNYNIDLKALDKSYEPLCKLKKMVGLEGVKKKIVDIVLFYLQRLDVRNFDLLHTIIDGAPGTGKTEIAQIYSELLVSLGILSKNIFKKAKKHDLIGGYLGHTAMKTNKLLEEVKGGVLFIDEIYSFGSSEGKDSKDIYSKEFVDLLMQFMSENKSDFVLVVAGYKDDIRKFFLSMNDGLERRFPIHLSIDEYSPSEMRDIFIKKVDEQKWKFPLEKMDSEFYTDFFTKNKEYFKFFGGDMENLFTKCKHAHSRNLIRDHTKIHRVIDKKDFMDGFELFKSNPEINERKNTDKFMAYYL
jgi:hypothetical protein